MDLAGQPEGGELRPLAPSTAFGFNLFCSIVELSLRDGRHRAQMNPSFRNEGPMPSQLVITGCADRASLPIAQIGYSPSSGVRGADIPQPGYRVPQRRVLLRGCFRVTSARLAFVHGIRNFE